MGFQDLLRRNSGDALPYHEHDGGDITGVIGSARIISATIDSLSVDKITGGTYVDTDLTFASGSDLVSSNYSAGVSGWTIQGDGNAEFQNVTVKGIVTTESGSAVDYRDLTNLAIVNADIVNLSASKINAGSMSSQYLDITTEIVVSAGGRISIGGNMKFGDNAGGTGWDGLWLGTYNYWRDTGTWEIGDVNKGLKWDGSSLNLKDSVITGDITLSGGKFLTAASPATRLEISGSATNYYFGATLVGTVWGQSTEMNITGYSTRLALDHSSGTSRVELTSTELRLRADSGAANTSIFIRGSSTYQQEFWVQNTERARINADGIHTSDKIVFGLGSNDWLAHDDTNNYLYWWSDGVWRLRFQASNYLDANPTLAIAGNMGSTTGTNVVITSHTGRYELHSDSSGEQFKTSIKPANPAKLEGLIDKLVPTHFRFKGRGPQGEKRQPMMLGLIAQNVAAVLPVAAIYDISSGDKVISDYNNRAVMALTVLEVQALRRRVAVLENA